MKSFSLVFTALFFAIGFSFAQGKVVVDEVIAVIGSEILLRSELEKSVAQYQLQGMVVDEGIKCDILEDLLFQKLLINQAKLDSVEITEKQLESELDRRIKYFVSQIGSEKSLEDYYKKSMEEIKSELRESLRDQMIIQQMQSTVTSNIVITPSEVRDFYESLPQDSLPFINTEVEVAQIVILAAPGRSQIEEARAKLNGLRERIIKGEDFATLAILYSEDPGTAKQGGELGFVGKAEVDPAFAETAFKLKGKEVSRIVNSEFGFHIIQLIDKKGDKVNVRHILVKPKILGEEILKAKEICDSLKEVQEAYDTLTFSTLATRHSMEEGSRNNGGLMINTYTGSSHFQYDQLDPVVYSAVEDLEVGELSSPIAYSTRDGKKGYSLYYLLSKWEAHQANLTYDYQKIMDAALAKKQEEEVRSWISKKLEKTYSSLNEAYQKCNFDNDWDKIN